MTLDLIEIDHIARLARLELSAEEKRLYQETRSWYTPLDY
jgi:Asp-tRNA(Asn)/Glu-tRNA(Gln) amidotransferase C subunit